VFPVADEADAVSFFSFLVFLGFFSLCFLEAEPFCIAAQVSQIKTRDQWEFEEFLSVGGAI